MNLFRTPLPALPRAAAAALVVAAALATLPAAAQTATPKPGGTLKIALRGDPGALDCHAISSSHVAFVLFPVYSTLLRFDPVKHAEIVGDAAASWSVSPDGLAYTFKLHPNIRFHDGSAFGAQDVKATYERLRAPPAGVTSLRQNMFRDIKAITVVDPLTVRFELATANSAMPTVFANPWNCLYSAAQLAKDPTFPSKTMMGTGPFKLVEKTPGSRITYEKFAGYFKPGLPYLDKLELIVLANAAVVPAISSGQVDADFFTFSQPLVDQITKARGDKTTFDTAETTTGAHLAFNTRRTPMGDVRVRRALSMAIDRANADANLRKLVAVRGTSPIYRAGTEYALPAAELQKLPGFGTDMNKAREDAKKLLQEAGVPNLKFTLLLPDTRDPYEAYGIFLVDAWRRIGVTVELKAVDSAAYQAAKTARDFDIVLEWNSSQSTHPIEVLDKFVPGTPGDFTGMQDDQLVNLYKQIKSEPDPVKLKALTLAFETRMLDQAWIAPLLWATRTTAVPSNLRGWDTPPSFSFNLDHARIWLDR